MLSNYEHFLKMIIENQKNQSRYHLILIIPNLLKIIKTKDFLLNYFNNLKLIDFKLIQVNFLQILIHNLFFNQKHIILLVLNNFIIH